MKVNRLINKLKNENKFSEEINMNEGKKINYKINRNI